ncbi:ankyrin [Lentithecium fluviatile CBS 122367]|uniref:Ankyrin n=1 Tax=Lentithecium fluviatile CBS 122367 TaxID=1168545 RepID=A0A6G1IMR4_9PLEO|nr:ankyrin [Lentithecium fluviatile CBS 122367]
MATSRQRRTRISEEEWDKHKDTIRDLFLTQNKKLEGEDGLITIMEKNHTFSASRAQYETRLKRWDFRKYANKDQWNAIFHTLDVRESQGKETEVVLRGEVLRQERIEKERKRYGATGLPKTLPHAIKPLPECIRIRTPPLTALAIRNAPSSSPLETTQPRSDAEAFSEESPVELPLTFEHEYPTFQTEAWRFVSNANVNMRFFDPCPLSDLRLWVLSDQRSSALGFLDQLGNTMLPIPTRLMRHLEKPVLERFPFQNLCAPNTFYSLSTRAPELQVLYVTIFALSNNLVRLDTLNSPENSLDELFQTVTEYFNRLSSREFTQILDTFQQPMRQALELGVFRAAVELGACQVVNTILDRGLNPNEVVMVVRGIRYTPLERACVHAWVDISRSLLLHKANPERGLHSSMQDHCLPLEVRKGSFIPPARVEIFEQLLQHGMRVPNFLHDYSFVPPMQPAIYYASAKYIIEPQYDVWSRSEFLYGLLACGENGMVTPILDGVLSQCDWNSLNPGETLMECLNIVAFRNNYESFRRLLVAGAVPVYLTLKKAVEGKSLRIIEYLLDVGEPWTGSRGNFPIAEVIRSESDEIKSTFWKRGLFRVLEENYEVFVRSFGAACKVGDEAMLDHCLNLWNDCSERFGNLSYTEWSPRDDIFAPAIENNRLDIVEKLLAAGLCPGRTALGLALRADNDRLARLIMEAIPDISSCFDGLHLAILSRKSTSIVHGLIAGGVSLSHVMDGEQRFGMVGRFPLMPTALISGDKQVISLLLSLDAPLEIGEIKKQSRTAKKKVVTPLYAAVRMKNFCIVKEFIARGVNPCDSAAILEASSTGDFRTTRFLLEATETWHPRHRKGFGAEALHEVVIREDIGMLSLLLKYTDPNHLLFLSKNRALSKISAFGAAISSKSGKSLVMIKAFLDHGADANGIAWIPDSDGGEFHTEKAYTETALMRAISTSELTNVQLLIASGANISMPATLGLKRTPLQYAAEGGFIHIVCYLLDQGANPNKLPAMCEGGTALQLAAGGGYLGIVDLLIQHGALINAPACMLLGRTAFERAAENGRMEMLVYLVQHGADIVSDGGKQHKCAVLFAKENGHLGVVSLVESLYAEACENAVMQDVALLDAGLQI